MRRVLSIVSNNIEMGGVEKYLINAYKSINLDGFSIDVLVPGRILCQKNADQLINTGCNIIQLDLTQRKIPRLYNMLVAFRHIIKTGNYDIVHVNTGNITIEAIALKEAVNKHVPIRIAHSHGTVETTNIFKKVFRFINRIMVNKYATHKVACSQSAAESLFGKKRTGNVIIEKNGIDTRKFSFDCEIRNKVRRKNGWDNCFVIGSVGRIAPEKNYEFLIDVFFELYKEEASSILVLVGEGEDRSRIENKIQELNIQDRINIFGNREDIPELLQGFDVFVLTSSREAFGIVNIEAQATGLPCVVSDVVPKEIDYTGMVSFVPLDVDKSVWAKEIIKYKNVTNRISKASIAFEKGYDISTSYRTLNDIYHKDLDNRR